MRKGNLKYLQLLSKQYPTIDDVSTEIINLQAILNLPKGTEHFLTDIHGEYEQLQHVLKNASGVIKSEIERIFGNTLTQSEKKELATIIYYPEQKLSKTCNHKKGLNDWYKITMYRLIEVCRSFSSNYTRSKVRKAMPKSFNYILEELLYTQNSLCGNQKYYNEIVNSIIDVKRSREFIAAISKLIQHLAIDRLHIIGDIYDRGPGAEIIMDTLINYHLVDIQWGNHDILWIGAATGLEVCIANVIRISARYANLNTIENGYGINLLPLATFSLEYYKDDPCEWFFPKADSRERYDTKELRLISQMHKAITIIQFKLERDIILRHPEYNMDDRMLLDKIDYTNGTITLDKKTYKLLDSSFPTVDPENPFKLTPEEKELIHKLKLSFLSSEKLQKHIRFLFSSGSLYLTNNSNLLFHGCIPLESDGSFRKVNMGKRKLDGKNLLDYLEVKTREAFFYVDTENAEHRSDIIWFLWTGPHSPLFGKDKMATFERYFIDDKRTHTENPDPYYQLRDDICICDKIMEEFGLDPNTSHIINGHVPVEKKNGESPIKAGGKLISIDGGFSRAYQSKTGIAGFTLISDCLGLSLVTHEPFRSAEEAVKKGTDILSSKEVLERTENRKLVGDSDIGKDIRKQILNLRMLLDAYRRGIIKEQM
ncbi:MAG TPA: fructose-1,6-bisphosphatase [Ruminiclostridium sp.]|nr:fructose-1,6-bisphosphatase [Ruminiclostridium sp.]